MRDRLVRGALLGGAAATVLCFAVAWALVLSQNVPRSDDLVYIEWALAHASTPHAALLWPPPFPGWRPASSLSWWLSSAVDGHQGEAAAALPGALWVTALAAWGGLAARRRDALAGLAMALLLLSTPWFRDLPTWRSWLTTTGEIALLGLALHALEARRTAAAAVLAALAVGFKEPAALLLTPVAVLHYRQPVVGGVAALAAVPSVVRFALATGSGSTVAASVPAELGWYVDAIGGSGWLPVLALGSVHPLLAPLGLGGLIGGVAAPLAGGLAAAIGVGQAIRSRSPWGLGVGALATLPLLYDTRNPVYLLEGALVVLLLFVSAPRDGWRRWFPVVLAVLASVPTWPASLENLRWQNQQHALAVKIREERRQEPPGRVHLAPEAHDGGRYAAWWLVQARGWEASPEPLAIDLCHGVTIEPAAAPAE